MAKAVIQANIQSANGSVIVAPNASIYITDAASGSPVTLWSDRAGLTPLPGGNPATADANGFFRVYANPGRVNIEATYGGNTQTWMDVPILESGDVALQVGKTIYSPTANYWLKLVSYVGDINETFLIHGRGKDGHAVQCVIHVHTESALDAVNSKVEVLSISGPASNIEHNSFMIAGSGVAGGTNALWVQGPSLTLSQLSITSLGKNDYANTSISYHDQLAAVAAAPTGAVVITSDWAGSGYIAPTLTNGWTELSSVTYPVRYEKDASGLVSIEGLLAITGASTSSCMTLPAGYRPSKTQVFVCANENEDNPVRATVLATTGFVEIAWTTLPISFISLSSIKFKARL